MSNNKILVKLQSYSERKLQSWPENKKRPAERTNSYGAHGGVGTAKFCNINYFFYSFALIIVIDLMRFNKMIGIVVDTIDMSTTTAELMRANCQLNLIN